MALDLHERTSGTPVFTGGLSIDNLSWWFWIKAGIGVTLGIWLTIIVLAAPSAYLFAQFQLWWLKLYFRL